MKKIIVALTVVLLLLTGCAKPAPKTEKLLVSATLDPHSKILEFVKPILLEKYNIELEIQVLDDYYIFNKALDAGEVDANYFQHVPFFNSQIAENGYKISNVAGIHIEPFGFYSTKIKSLAELPDGATIVISNVVSDNGRILKILEANGLIKLKDGVDAISATMNDIVENPKNLKFSEIKPELLTTAYNQGEGDLVAINGNYALQAGLQPTKDAVMLEEGTADNPFVNILAVKQGNENDSRIKALIEVLKSEEVKQFILDTYADGSVIPAK